MARSSWSTQRTAIGVVVALQILANLAYVAFVITQLPAPNGQLNAIALYVMSLFCIFVDVFVLWLVSYNPDDPAGGNPHFTATKVAIIIASAVALIGHLSLVIVNATNYERNDRDWRFVVFYWIAFGQFVLGTVLLAMATFAKRPEPQTPAVTSTTSSTSSTSSTATGPTVVVNQVPTPVLGVERSSQKGSTVESDEMVIRRRQ